MIVVKFIIILDVFMALVDTSNAKYRGDNTD